MHHLIFKMQSPLLLFPCSTLLQRVRSLQVIKDGPQLLEAFKLKLQIHSKRNKSPFRLRPINDLILTILAGVFFRYLLWGNLWDLENATELTAQDRANRQTSFWPILNQKRPTQPFFINAVHNNVVIPTIWDSRHLNLVLRLIFYFVIVKCSTFNYFLFRAHSFESTFS